MTPYYTDDWLTLYGGDCRQVLASLPAESVSRYEKPGLRTQPEQGEQPA